MQRIIMVGECVAPIILIIGLYVSNDGFQHSKDGLWLAKGHLYDFNDSLCVFG